MLNIYLPGYSQKNLSDLELFESTFKEFKLKSICYQWRHWSNENSEWDPEIDIRNILGQISSQAPTINIIAKSQGTQVATLLANKISSKLNKLILMGIPLYDLEQEEKVQIKSILKDNNFDLTIIHNNMDTHGNWEDVQEFLNGIEYNLIIKESDTHDYKYTHDVIQLIK